MLKKDTDKQKSCKIYFSKQTLSTGNMRKAF